MTAASPTAQAEEILTRLEAHIDAYTRQVEPAGEQGFARLFRGWFTCDPRSVEPVHARFLETLSELVGELAGALAELAPRCPEESRSAAARAAALLLAPPPDHIQSDKKWYLQVAAYQCRPILPWLSRTDLQSWRDELLGRTPRRLMYPKELELVSAMEDLLEKMPDRDCACV